MSAQVDHARMQVDVWTGWTVINADVDVDMQAEIVKQVGWLVILILTLWWNNDINISSATYSSILSGLGILNNNTKMFHKNMPCTDVGTFFKCMINKNRQWISNDVSLNYFAAGMSADPQCMLLPWLGHRTYVYNAINNEDHIQYS